MKMRRKHNFPKTHFLLQKLKFFEILHFSFKNLLFFIQYQIRTFTIKLVLNEGFYNTLGYSKFVLKKVVWILPKIMGCSDCIMLLHVLNLEPNVLASYFKLHFGVKNAGFYKFQNDIFSKIIFKEFSPSQLI